MNWAGVPADSWLADDEYDHGLPADSHRFAGWIMMSTIMAYLGIAIGLLAV